NPELIVAAVVGDGESETGPLATSWHINKFLSPIRDGAVLPILHLNGYKINNPTLLARISHEELESLMRGYGWTPCFVEGSEHESMHQAMADDGVLRHGDQKNSEGSAREGGSRAAAVAHDCSTLAERVDGSGNCGRPQTGRVLARASSSDHECEEERGAPAVAGKLDARVQARRTVR